MNVRLSSLRYYEARKLEALADMSLEWIGRDFSKLWMIVKDIPNEANKALSSGINIQHGKLLIDLIIDYPFLEIVRWEPHHHCLAVGI